MLNCIKESGIFVTEVVFWIYLWFAFFLLVPCFDIFVSFLIFLPVVGDGDARADTRPLAPRRPPYVWLRTTPQPPLMPGQHTPEVSEIKDDWRNHRFQLFSHHDYWASLFTHYYSTPTSNWYKLYYIIICYIIKNNYMRFSDLWKLNFPAPIVNWSEILVSDWRRAN